MEKENTPFTDGMVDDLFSVLTAAQCKKIIQKEREVYLKGGSISYSWEEVRWMALDKEKRHGLQFRNKTFCYY